MKKLIVIFLSIFPLWAFAQADYYPASLESRIKAGELNDAALKTALVKVISSPHNNLGYKGARSYLFGQIYLKKDKRGHYLKDEYCNKEFRRTDIGPMKIPDQNVVNCEHTWPQSKFSGNFSKTLQQSDLHHLFVTSMQANSTRGNNPFGEILGQHPSDCEASSYGTMLDPSTNKSTLFFNPPNEHKGNVARALFYFSVRYNLRIDPTQEKTLREWHLDDPADQEEREANDQIQKIQGNRNPFIDYSELPKLISDF